MSLAASARSTGVTPPGTGYVDFLNTIRGPAITAVALVHGVGAAFYTDQLPWQGAWRSFEVGRLFRLLTPLTYGWAGVGIFFVVSGFAFTSATNGRDRISRRRISRGGFSGPIRRTLPPCWSSRGYSLGPLIEAIRPVRGCSAVISF